MKAHKSAGLTKCTTSSRLRISMKVTLEPYGGIKGSRAAVYEVATTSERNKDSKIPGISVLNKISV